MTISENPISNHLRKKCRPSIHETAFIHEMAFVSGDVTIGREVFVAPFASIRADEGSPFFIGDFSNVQDGVVLHALETFHEDGSLIEKNLMDVGGRKYSIYIGTNVSLAHQSQIHGPSVILEDTFIGMQSFIFKSLIEKGCAIEPGVKVMGVNIKSGRYVPAGSIINSQEKAEGLPFITKEYTYKDLNNGVVKVNRELAGAYSKQVTENR